MGLVCFGEKAKALDEHIASQMISEECITDQIDNIGNK